MKAVDRRAVLGFRLRSHQLDREPGSGTVGDTTVLDLGVQDTGVDGALWALGARGVDTTALPDDALAMAWTLRGAPHVYRRADLPEVAAATWPFSDADAGKRIFDAAKPLKAAGIGNLEALDEVAGAMRKIVVRPTVKGDVSRRLTTAMSEPYRRFCRPCNAIHLYEQTFRLAALRAGLELEPGTSPPVLCRVPGFRRRVTYADRLDVVRGYLRLHGPATPKQVAAYIDAPVREVSSRRPEDAVDVTVAGETRWLLADDVDRLGAPNRGGEARLLAAFDPWLQTRDRGLVVPDASRHKDLWRVLGRPGGVLFDAEVVGTWRAHRSGRAVTVTVEAWTRVTARLRAGLEAEAERLAAFRELRLRAVDVASG